MPDAFVKYRSGGGYQKVAAYDYVFDSRKYLENGTYRDSGFSPMVIPKETLAIDSNKLDAIIIGTGGLSNTSNYGTSVELNTASLTSAYQIYTQQPDEVSHTAPRQLSYYDTTLTFCADSDTSVALTVDHTTDTMQTAAPHGLGGKRIVISTTTTMPAGLVENTLYYPVNITTANTFQVSLSQNGPAVNFTSNGTGTITAMVVDTIAEFPWRDIMGWSNTEPTR